MRRYRWALARGSGVGTLIGALPGAGADIAAWIAYGISKRFSKTPEKFGTGHLEGIVEAGAANNAALSGAWIPALVFGIPGDSITAIVIGVLYLKGLNPGPTIFLENPATIYAVLMTMFLANLLMLPLGWGLIKAARNVLRVPRGILMPIVLLFAVVGAFAINNSTFDVGVMLAFGLLAFVMEANRFPIAPTILGLVLGGMLEQHFVTSMIKADGDVLAFFERPVAGVLGVVTLLVWVSPLVMGWWRQKSAG
jgi:TctA family transporter